MSERLTYPQLTALDHLDIGALESLYALEMSGEAFYAALAAAVDDDEARELLRRNGREEAGHARRIGRALSLKLGREFIPTSDMLEPAPVKVPSRLSPKLLASLVQGEIDGGAGYDRWAEHEPDPAVQRLYRLNAREECIHGERISQVLAILGEG